MFYRSGDVSDEKKRGRFDRPFVLAAAALLLLLSGVSVAADTQEVPVIKAGLGPCSVNFTVEDGSHKPLYDAKIDVTVRYGFLSLRKTYLEVGTNGDGKARFEGLPSRVKKALEFRVRHGQLTKTITHDPADRCQASYTVVLTTQ